MMGMKARLLTPVTALTLDDLVPADHFYRHLDRVLDLTFVRDLVYSCYVADKGRPSVDPVVFFRLQLVMFFEGIRSERQLLRLAADRLSVRWYLGYNLDEPLPDHSMLTRIRLRYGLAIFRRFFEAIVEQCQRAGLVWGRELYFDATQVQADASLDSLTARFAVDAHQARQARHEREAQQGAQQAKEGRERGRDDEEQKAVQGPQQAMEAHLARLFPQDDVAADPLPMPTLPTAPNELAEPPAPTPVPLTLPDELREELETANAARHDWIAQEGRQQREVRGVYQRTADLRISTTDPDATPMRLKGGGTHLGYQTHYVVDGGSSALLWGCWWPPARSWRISRCSICCGACASAGRCGCDR